MFISTWLLHDKLPKTFNNIFVKAKDTHGIYTRNANDGNIALPRYNSTNYGLNSIYKQCIDAWNKFTYEQKRFDKIQKSQNKNYKLINLHNISRNKLKQLITNYFIDSY